MEVGVSCLDEEAVMNSRCWTIPVVLLLAVTIVGGSARAEMFALDLKDLAGSGGGGIPIEFPHSFSSIDEVQLIVEGGYTPSIVQRVAMGGLGPELSYHGMHMWWRLGDTDSAWNEKLAYTTLQLGEGDEDFSSELSMRGTVVYDPPSLLPGGDEPIDYSFLLDGRAELAGSSIVGVPDIYYTVKSASVSLETFTLIVHGTAVPEGSSVMLGLLGVALGSVLVARQRTSGGYWAA